MPIDKQRNDFIHKETGSCASVLFYFKSFRALEDVINILLNSPINIYCMDK